MAQTQSVAAGPLEFELGHGGVRSVRWHGVNVLGAIAWPMRNPNWGTWPEENPREKFEQKSDGSVRFERRFAVADGRLCCTLIIAARPVGILEARIDMEAVENLQICRAGFTVLHPSAGVEGAPLVVTHPDGSVETTAFPRLISPAQPAREIAGLRYEVRGVGVDLTFGGEIFEMEDQRNWSDASFKTYCRPLRLPFPFSIRRGESLSQSLRLELRGAGVERAGAAAQRGEETRFVAVDGERLPEIALAIERAWLPDSNGLELVAETGVRRVHLRTGPETDERFLLAGKSLAEKLGAKIELELVVPEDGEDFLRETAAACRRVGLTPAEIQALPAPYLKSYQPDGVWPDGWSPRDAARSAAHWFPGTPIGSGLLTNFTELNRCRPEPSQCDFIMHETCAIVHAADDRSVIETLEALPAIFSSARALAPGRPYRLGLVAIGMRTNPYGREPAGNPQQIRLPMAHVDPRQRGLYGAAWAVGAAASTAGHGIESIALAAPVGPFGVVSTRAAWPRPGFDTDPEANVYPIFHVVKALARIGGSPRFRLTGLPAGVAAVAGEREGRMHAVVANLTSEPRRVSLAEGAGARVLDASSFVAAVRDSCWLDRAPVVREAAITLAPYGVVFVEAGGIAP